MSKNNVQVSVSINQAPETVLAFVADIRNRAKYQKALKAISEIVEQPEGVGTTWKWKWDFLGQELEGIGKCVEYQPGKKYVFVTEGAIVSQFAYRAQPEGAATKLTIDVEFELPEALVKQAGEDQLLAIANQKGQEAVQSLKAILEQ